MVDLILSFFSALISKSQKVFELIPDIIYLIGIDFAWKIPGSVNNN